MFTASSSQLGCYLKECIIPCYIFWPPQGAFIGAAGRERERDGALESSRGFPQHLCLKKPLNAHLAKCFLWDVKIYVNQTKGVWNVLRACWCTVTNSAVAIWEGVTAGAPQSSAKALWSSGVFWGPGVHLNLCRGRDKPQTQGGFSPRGDKPYKPSWVWTQASNILVPHVWNKSRPLDFLLFQSVRSHMLSLPVGNGRVHR